ncbi:MAG TPA: hypothetical protein ENN69_02915, partial [Spirochaetia bacterium]|nr:hypothetical protein [Spirochaetia bacterium]
MPPPSRRCEVFQMSPRASLNRPTLGLIIDWLENPYQVQQLEGIEKAAIKNDVNLITFIGGAYKSPRFHEASRNMIYKFIDKRNVDGLIVSMGSVAHFCNQLEFSDFIRSFSPLPIVTIAGQLNPYHAVLVDNRSGLREILIHLIRDHGYRRIAFVQGTPTNVEAIERFNLYMETLSDFGIIPDPALVCPGDFTPEAGEAAVQTLLHERGTKVDAIVASNDDMAFGVILALRRRKISVPGDIAVTGFDDLELCRYLNPSLTTVREPIFEQGEQAVGILVSLINGEKVPKTTVLKTRHVIRESCGCMTRSFSQDSSAALRRSFAKPQNKLTEPERMVSVFREPEQQYFSFSTKDEEVIRILGDALADAVAHTQEDFFLNALNRLLFKIDDGEFTMEYWQQAISAVRFRFLPEYREAAAHEFVENVFHVSRYRIGEFDKKNREYLRMVDERQYQLFRDISEELSAKLDMEDIVNLLARELPHLKIKSCFFSLFEGGMGHDPQNLSSRLILAYNEKGRIDLKDMEVRFPSVLLFPPNIISGMQWYSFIAEPVFFGKNSLGIVLFELDYNPGFLYSIMRRMFLNNAFKGAVFVQQLQDQSLDLEKTNHELKETLERLRTTQRRLVESEKMAALGDLVAGVAHEINTPIGIGVTAASHLAECVALMEHKFKGNQLTKSEFEQYVADTTEATSMILSNLKRAYELIRSFKQIAVDQSSEEKRKFPIRKYLAEILLALRPQLKKTNHKIEIDCPEDLVIESYPGAFAQIVTNLVINSLVHGFDPGVN